MPSRADGQPCAFGHGIAGNVDLTDCGQNTAGSIPCRSCCAKEGLAAPLAQIGAVPTRISESRYLRGAAGPGNQRIRSRLSWDVRNSAKSSRRLFHELSLLCGEEALRPGHARQFACKRCETWGVALQPADAGVRGPRDELRDLRCLRGFAAGPEGHAHCPLDTELSAPRSAWNLPSTMGIDHPVSTRRIAVGSTHCGRRAGQAPNGSSARPCLRMAPKSLMTQRVGRTDPSRPYGGNRGGDVSADSER